ncbi:MAG: haloacid dehalogenase-like hydrolase [Candidatus Paceibacterota bacterium]
MNKKITKIAKNIKAVILDADGVIFTGRAFVDQEGEKYKERSHIDGQGISLLRAAGLRIAIVSGGIPGFVESIGKRMNNLPSVKNGTWPPVAVFLGEQASGEGKIIAIENWLKENNLDWKECVYMGDDLGDYQMLQKVGLPSAPAQAEQIIKKIAKFIAQRRGGDGAIRDLADFILKSKKIDPTILTLK